MGRGNAFTKMAMCIEANGLMASVVGRGGWNPKMARCMWVRGWTTNNMAAANYMYVRRCRISVSSFALNSWLRISPSYHTSWKIKTPPDVCNRCDVQYPDSSLAYEGDWVMGKMSGEGVLRYQANFGAKSLSRRCYEGCFEKNKFEGRGTFYFPMGNCMTTGVFCRNQFHGSHTMHWKNGLQLTCSFTRGQCHDNIFLNYSCNCLSCYVRTTATQIFTLK